MFKCTISCDDCGTHLKKRVVGEYRICSGCGKIACENCRKDWIKCICCGNYCYGCTKDSGFLECSSCSKDLISFHEEDCFLKETTGKIICFQCIEEQTKINV